MRKAFTLIELMIVVAILGILASIVIPQLQGNTIQAKESAAKSILATLRSQIELYKMQHNGRYPGYYGMMPIIESTCVNQLIYPTSANGNVGASKTPDNLFPYGPYLQEFPRNPFNGKNTILYVAAAGDFLTCANDTTGWLYKRETGEIRLNTTKSDASNTPYASY